MTESKADADGPFLLRAEFRELLEFGVVGFYRFVCGFDVEHRFPPECGDIMSIIT